jgi:hypothetical protein
LIVGAGRLELSRVLGDGWRCLRERWGRMLVALVLFGWVPQIVANIAYLLGAPLAGVGGGAATAGYAIAAWINVGAPIVMRAVATAVALKPPKTSVWQAIVATVRATPALAPVWLISLAPSAAAFALQYLGSGRGQVDWLIAAVAWPFGLVVAVVLGVSSPVVLAEGLGPLAAARRSFELLSGSRWKFLALYLLFQLLAVAPRFLATLLAGAHGFGATGDHVTYFADQLGGVLAQDAVMIWWAAVAVAVYLELARVRDGLAPRDVVEVFA